MIFITDTLSIAEEELTFTASRSSGPGGQHVNKVSSKVILWFDVGRSPNLSDTERELITSRLGSRIDKEGILRVVSQSTRSQLSNREIAVERFIELLQYALKQTPARKKTRASKAAKLRRLQEKKQRSRIKSVRSGKISTEE